MTTEAIEATPEATSELAKLESQLVAIDADIAKLQSDAQAEIARLSTITPIDVSAIAAAARPAADAIAKRTSLSARIEEARKADAFESSIEIRQPVLDVLHDLVVEARPQATITSVNGELSIGDDDAVTVTLRAVLKAPSMDDIEEMIAASVDVDAFKAAGFVKLGIDVSGIGGEKPIARLFLPDARKASTGVKREATASDGDSKARSGALVWDVNGTSMSSKEMLTWASENASDHEAVKSHATALANVLAGGNGMSNLAKALGPKLGFESSVKDPDA